MQQVGIIYYTCNAAAWKMQGIKFEKLKFRVQPHRIKEANELLLLNVTDISAVYKITEDCVV